MKCSVCGSESHLEGDNWQCGWISVLNQRLARLEARVDELTAPTKITTEVSTNG